MATAWQPGGGLASPLVNASKAFESETLPTGGGGAAGAGAAAPTPSPRGPALSFAHMDPAVPSTGGQQSYYQPPPVPRLYDPLDDYLSPGSTAGAAAAAAGQTLLVRLENGGHVELPYNPVWLGEDIKRELELREAVDFRRQRLWTADGTEVEDFSQLDQHGVYAGATLVMRLDPSPRRDHLAAKTPRDVEGGPREILLRRENSNLEPSGLNFNHELVITQMDPEGPAARSGVELGMRLLEVEGQPVRTTADVKRHFALMPGDLLLRLQPEAATPPAHVAGGEPAFVHEHPSVSRRLADPFTADQYLVQQAKNEDVYAFWGHRVCLTFMIFASTLTGMVMLAVDGEAENAVGADCTKIERWAVGCGVLLFLGGLSCACLWLYISFVTKENAFDITKTLPMIFMVSTSMLLLAFIIITIVGLAVMARHMDRVDRDGCSDYRGLMIFVIGATITVFVIFLCLCIVRMTWETNTKMKSQQYRTEAAFAAGLPSLDPHKYQRDPENAQIPYHKL
eukprot:Rhum_TRINITY_DN23357_c0_g1::Rhum_TRINITY_DN23357_c0_g1_i1::g.177780::m.177780